MTAEARRRPAPDSRVLSAAVVGAGLAGLAAAYRLRTAGWRVIVFEASASVGGRVQTVARDGYLIDTGASGLASSYRAYFDLASELRLEAAIQPTRQVIGVFARGRVHLLNLERALSAGLTTRLLSTASKLKLFWLALDVMAAARRGQLDFADMGRAADLDVETTAQYAARRLNREIDDYLCSPIIRTMLIAETGQISKVELFSGLLNILSTRIYALQGGQGRLPQALASRLDVRLHHRVTAVVERGDDVFVQSQSDNGHAREEAFDACVIAAPLPVAAAICPGRATLLEPLNESLGYTQAITVAVATNKPPDCPAFLIQMPHCEDSEVALMFLEHNKANDRVPPGRGLIGCDWSAAASETWFTRSDAEIIERTAQSVVRAMPDLAGCVEFAHVTRWKAALPYTKVGAYQRIRDFHARSDPASRIQFAGDYMSGAGQNTAIEFGNRAAEHLQNFRTQQATYE